MSHSSSSFRMASGRKRHKMAKRQYLQENMDIYIKHMKKIRNFYNHNCEREKSFAFNSRHEKVK